MRFQPLFDGLRQRQREITEEIHNGEYTLWSFLFPKPSRRFFLRLGIVVLTAWLICRFLLQPAIIRGASMEPTYAAHGVNFCVLPAYWFNEPRRGDVVILRYVGKKVMLLKRILAFAGETVEFRQGVCYVNGQKLHEPYVKYASDWTIPPRQVAPGMIYVMGDNRSMRQEDHLGGEISRSRVKGKPLW